MDADTALAARVQRRKRLSHTCLPHHPPRPPEAFARCDPTASNAGNDAVRPHCSPAAYIVIALIGFGLPLSGGICPTTAATNCIDRLPRICEPPTLESETVIASDLSCQSTIA
jgi:hypothetical protein